MAYAAVRSVLQLLRRVNDTPTLEQLTAAIRSIVTTESNRPIAAAFQPWQRHFCVSWTALVLDFSGPDSVDAQFLACAHELVETQLRAATRSLLPDLTLGEPAFRAARLLLAINEAADVAWTSAVVEATVGYLQSKSAPDVENTKVTAEALQLAVGLLAAPALDVVVGTRRGELEAAIAR